MAEGGRRPNNIEEEDRGSKIDFMDFFIKSHKMADEGGRYNIVGEEDRRIADVIHMDEATPSLECRKLRWIREDGSYEVDGSFHGIEYQRKILMLFALRAYKSYDKFQLATEVKMIPKFNDVVLAVNEGTGYRYILVQIKHCTTSFRIGAQALFSMSKNRNDYSLPVYFESYFKSRNNFLGEHDKIHALIICSNTGFWYGTECRDFVLREDMFEEVEFDDPIFDTKLLRFKKDFCGRDKLVSLLINLFGNCSKNVQNATDEEKVLFTVQENSEEEVSWRKSIAKKLSRYILKNVSNGVVNIQGKDNTIYKNMLKLKYINVLEARNGCFWFSSGFLEGGDLPKAAKDVKLLLFEFLYGVDECSLEGIRFEIDPKLTMSELPTKVDVEDFLSLLLFAVEQPTTTEVDRLNKHELSSILGLEDVGTHYSIFDSEMNQWMSSNKGRPKRKEDFDGMFRNLKRTLIFRDCDTLTDLLGRSN